MRRIELTGYTIGVLLICVGVFHLAVLLVTGDTWTGPVSWRKPMTFGLSFGLTLITIVWLSSYVRLGEQVRPWLLGLFAAACVLEVTLITVQAWRRVPSHFNLSTAVDGVIARLLAVGGALLIAVILALTFASFRAMTEVAASMMLAVRAGLVLLDISLLIGAVMIATGISRAMSGDQQSAYAAGKALKLAHGVTLHAVLVLPALAWLLARIGRPEPQRLRLVTLAVAGYALAGAASIVWSG
jgi:hypothetical protein